MKRLLNVDEFRDFRQRILSEKDTEYEKPTLVICAGTGGQASGANDVIRIIKRYILEKGLQEKIAVRITGCQGFCEMDPFILVQPGRHLYPKLNMEDVPRVIDSAIGGYVDDGLIYKDSRDDKRYHNQNDIAFFKKQTRTILGNNENLDPIRILNYIEQDGYAAAEKVLSDPNPKWIIDEVIKSGLRGRGGAGFPTGKKWEFAHSSGKNNEQKYIICNADEGDPGAYMDRSLLEGNPHAIIEGMLIAGIAIGATRGIIYVRGEYPLAIKHSLIALRQARDLGILGENIMGAGIDFDIEIFRGAGAFVCGEETALIRSIEDMMGEPRQRPPYPIEKGLRGHPTCINNVESLANIPVIINRGGNEYAKIGIPGNTGTKIFSLVGKIRNTGLVEVPLGTKISEVVYDIGGGPVREAKIKAVQTGGPSGGCIPARLFDMSIDYDSLAKAGSIMGSGGMIVMDENTCMVDVAKYFMAFLKDESCGKCFTCRKGTQRMHEILDDISKGQATPADLDLLEELALVVRDTTMCGLGQSASNPILSNLRYFREEFERHIIDKRCDAFVCKELVGAPCQSACPVGTEAWRYVAHIERGEYEKAYMVIREANPFPSVCARVCNHPCEEKCRAGTSGGDAIAIRALKRFVTDQVDPSIFKPDKSKWTDGEPPRVAIVGSGPAGITAAHYLSLKGYKVTVFEAEDRPGGMLYCAIPSYRLPKDVITKEIDSLLNDNIEIKCNTVFGSEITLEKLQQDYRAILLAFGAHKSRPLRLKNENVEGIIPSIQFLKAFNLKGDQLARGRVGVIGGGNSAIDAARIAIRQKDVESVTILYRRTEEEMPAFSEEIQAAKDEGANIITLVSPSKVIAENGKLTSLECIKNELGDIDSSGRRRPVPIDGSNHIFELDTLIVAIGEDTGIENNISGGKDVIELTKWNTIQVNPATLATNISGVFAAGDVLRGPDTVINAIADGKKSAQMIDRFLRDEKTELIAAPILPHVYIEPSDAYQKGEAPENRTEIKHTRAAERVASFNEVEFTLSKDEAICEARRCLRCDLEFTQIDLEKNAQFSTKVKVS
ncbi:MAG: FAD-dependent oxidoreductase [Candidatus Zixiibacteriota bacterium]|nr:MAG: FAD-dependent oxidoreductase [candidate division Zixibacteria bacterium]